MPFISGDNRRRQLRRLSTKSITQASTASKESAKTNGTSSEQTPVVRKRRESKGAKHNGANGTGPPVAGVPEPTAEDQGAKAPKKDDVNVFKFMEKDEASAVADTDHSDSDLPDLSPSSNSSSSQSESPHPPQQQSPYSELEVDATEQKEGFLWYDNHRRDHSLNSDSGVSMLSASPAGKSPILGFKNKFHKPDDEAPTLSHGETMSGLIRTSIPEHPAARISHSPTLDLHLVEEPESYYSSSPRPRPQPKIPNAATTEDPQAGLQPSWQPSAYQSSQSSRPPPLDAQIQVGKSSCDLSASGIECRNEASLMPIYRKFETLNNRILLYLQDEITKMEEDLKRLDATIAEEDGQAVHLMAPTHMYPSQSKWQRHELMCRILARVEQYNTALSSYSNLTNSLQPASQNDIHNYQEWIAKHAPLRQEGAEFLHNGADLMTLLKPKPPKSLYPQDIPTMVVVVTLVSTIVVFRVVPSLLARLVISAVAGLASLFALAPHVLTDVKKIRASKRLIG
ncbi:MAG: hypothetical protein Q9191_004349, partial [Dirinaria sp. TL-2023a]